MGEAPPTRATRVGGNILSRGSRGWDGQSTLKKADALQSAQFINALRASCVPVACQLLGAQCWMPSLRANGCRPSLAGQILQARSCRPDLAGQILRARSCGPGFAGQIFREWGADPQVQRPASCRPLDLSPADDVRAGSRQGD